MTDWQPIETAICEKCSSKAVLIECGTKVCLDCENAKIPKATRDRILAPFIAKIEADVLEELKKHGHPRNPTIPTTGAREG